METALVGAPVSFVGKVSLTHSEVGRLVLAMAKRIDCVSPPKRPLLVYPIPRGGIPVAYRLAAYLAIQIVDDPVLADIFVDDIVDSGATLEKWSDEYPGKLFFALIDKLGDPQNIYQKAWVVFPWERNEGGSVEDNIRRLLQYIGEDVSREGLVETPARVAKAYKHWFSGYTKNPADVLKVFEDGAEGCDEMVVVRNLPFYSHCEHHLAPIFGTITVAYIPNGRIIGLSKIPRLIEVFARRLQVQERLGNQIADAMMTHLGALGVGVIVQARHLCMESRGVERIGAETVTSALRGVFKEQASTRSEFMSLLK